MRKFLWLCVTAGAISTTTPPRAAKREAVEKAAESARGAEAATADGVTVALYLVIAEGSEFRAAVTNSSFGKRMAIPISSTVNYVKKKISSIGSSESVTTADSEAEDPSASKTSPPSPPSPDSPSLKAGL